MEERITELEAIIDNLLVQSGLSIAKQGALMQMVLGVYRETLPPEKYQAIAQKFISLWERYCLDTLDGLEGMLYDSDMVERQKQLVHENIAMMQQQFVD